MKKCNKLFKMLAACAILVMMFGVTSMAAGTKVVNMTAAGNGGYSYQVVGEDSTNIVFHKFTVNKSGLIAVAGLSVTSYGSEAPMSVTLCNSKMQSIDASTSGAYLTNSDTVAYYGLKKGTYYLKVTNEENYAIAVQLKAMTDKGGASKKKATNVKKKKQITGVMPAGEKAKKADWFKIKLTKSQKLKLNIAVSGNGYFDFYIYGPGYPSKGRLLKSMKNTNGKFTCYRTTYTSSKKYGLKAGTYYVKVQRYSSDKKASGAYTLKWN